MTHPMMYMITRLIVNGKCAFVVDCNGICRDSASVVTTPYTASPCMYSDANTPLYIQQMARIIDNSL